jgi:two-component system sensor histidine kinase NblS
MNVLNKLKKVKTYALMPEMRVFWLFLILFVITGAVVTIYVPKALTIPVLAVLAISIVVLFILNLKFVATTHEANMQRGQVTTIINNLQDGIIAYNSDFTVLIFNKAAENIFDLKAEQIVGNTFTPDKIREPMYRLLVQVLFPALAPSVTRFTPLDVYPQEARLSFEEPLLELRVVTSRITGTKGDTLGFFKSVHDETRERALLKAKSDFITVAAHQLRTPLAAINWIFQGLKSGGFGPLDETQKEVIETGVKATNKLTKTVDDLLDVSRIEEGRFGYTFSEASAADVIEKTIEPYLASAAEHNVKLYFDKPKEAIAPFKMDATKISIALQNFLDNAIKYNVEGGEVTVKLERVEASPYVQISVRDTGVGIPKEEMDKLFTKFFRAQNILKYETEGTGLGLYIARNIIKRHGGTVRGESELNHGTTFFILLPTDESLIPKKEAALEEFM